MTEREKMLAGKVYDACDAELLVDLNATKVRCQQYNNLVPTDIAARNSMLRDMLGRADADTFINQPFYCDYGKHIFLGKRFFANFGFTVLDEAYVTIGDDCFVGPHVHIYTACHSTDQRERNTRQEWSEPVSIGNNVWIGGSVVILPGVSIGDNCTIGAGSVVTHDIPANSIAVGNPARVIKDL
jgi:maltose O-acetyltransferase